MLLVIDVGNTNIVLGIFKGKELMDHWRVSTDRLRTTDEYGVLIRNLFYLLEDFHWDETRFPVKSALTASSTPSQRMKNSAARSSSSTLARRRPSAPSTRKGPTSAVLSARASASLQMPWYSARRNCRVSKSSARIRSFAATPSKVCRPVSSMASSAR